MPAIARVGDEVACQKHGKTTIVTGGTQEIDGKLIARKGDECACGCVIVEGSSIMEQAGQAVAYVGCKTACGGEILTGSDRAEIVG